MFSPREVFGLHGSASLAVSWGNRSIFFAPSSRSKIERALLHPASSSSRRPRFGSEADDRPSETVSEVGRSPVTRRCSVPLGGVFNRYDWPTCMSIYRVFAADNMHGAKRRGLGLGLFGDGRRARGQETFIDLADSGRHRAMVTWS